MKKLMFFSVLTLGIASLLGACSNEEMPDFPNPQPSSQTNNLGLDRALQIVDGMMKELDGGVTRSSRKIITIEKVNTTTRSDADMPNWYVINYDNEAGFALINDAAVDCPVYGISNTGRLSMTDTLENKGLAMVLNNIFVMGYVDSQPNTNNDASNTENSGIDNGYIPGQPISPGFPSDSTLHPWKPINPPTETLEVAPLLTQYVQKWGQGSPFNVLCPMVYNEEYGMEMRGYVGCGPLAMAMIMSHYQWPLTYYSSSPNETYEFHWDEIRDYAYRYATSRLTREISRAYNMDAHWEGDGTWVYWHNAPKTFENFGYNKPSVTNFKDMAYKTITDRVPILVSAQGVTPEGKSTAHMWVIDGLLRVTSNDAALTTSIMHCYHCVWGWDAVSNGYFSMFDYQSSSGGYKYDDRTLPNQTGYQFYNFEAIGGLTPNK